MTSSNEHWANSFDDIPHIIRARDDLKEMMLALVRDAPILTEDSDLVGRLRGLLLELIVGDVTLPEAAGGLIGTGLDDESAYALVRLQYSRFYNQTVMELLIERGESRVLVPQISNNDYTAPCTVCLAGKGHSIQTLHKRLIEAYSEGTLTDDSVPRIPQGPFCNHVIKPFKTF